VAGEQDPVLKLNSFRIPRQRSEASFSSINDKSSILSGTDSHFFPRSSTRESAIAAECLELRVAEIRA